MSIDLKVHNKAMGLHDLMVRMLRDEGLLRKLTHEKLVSYCYNVGVALHNIPFAIHPSGKLETSLLVEINAIDPSAAPGVWGDWVKLIVEKFEQELPVCPT